MTPYIHDLNQRTLAQDMDAFMANGISDEDPEVLAKASAIRDEEARMSALPKELSLFFCTFPRVKFAAATCTQGVFTDISCHTCRYFISQWWVL